MCSSSFRFHAQGDQSGPRLRHHDQHLRVWEGLLPEGQPGGTVSRVARQDAQEESSNWTQTDKNPPTHRRPRRLAKTQTRTNVLEQELQEEARTLGGAQTSSLFVFRET